MKKSVKYLIGITFALLAVIALCQVSGDAEADTCVFTGAVSAVASNDSNWNIVGAWTTHHAPGVGDAVIFNTTSAAKPCTWDIGTLGLAQFRMLTGYSGTITQTAGIDCSSYYKQAGTMVYSSTLPVNVTQNFVVTGGSATNILGALNCRGSGYIATISSGGQQQVFFTNITGNYILNNTMLLTQTTGTRGLAISGTLTLSQLADIQIVAESAAYMNITGRLTGIYDQQYSSTGPILDIQGRSSLFIIPKQSGYLDVMIVFRPASASSYLKLGGDIRGLSVTVVTSATTSNLDLNGYNLTLTNELDIGRNGIVRNTASTNSWIHAQGFRNNTGSGNLYTSHIYTSWVSWNPHLMYSASTVGNNGSVYQFLPAYNETVTGMTLVTHPAWLNIVGSYVIGTPTVAGQYFAELQATSQNGTLISIDRWYIDVANVTVYNGGLEIVGDPTLFLQAGGFYNVSFTLNGTGTITALHLPAWLTLSGNGTASGPWVLTGFTPFPGNYSVSLMAVGNGTSYLNYTVKIVSTNPVVIDTTTDMILALLFLIFVTIFNIYGNIKNILLLQLIAVTVMLPGVVWAFIIMGEAWFIPLLFVIVNLVLFLTELVRGRK